MYTTTNDENHDRSVYELIRLNTYQGMTDSEIESVIKWRENNAYAKGNRDAVNSQGMINVQELARKNEALYNHIADMVKSIDADIQKHNARLCNE